MPEGRQTMPFLSFYNPTGIGDTLILTAGSCDKALRFVETNDSITVIKNKESQAIIGINIFNISDHLEIDGQGQVFLTDDQVATINQLLKTANFDFEVTVDNQPKFVVGEVEECVDHEDSDHLHITKTRVAPDEVLQIVCGAPNIAQGLKVLVAKTGAVMPSGMIIWPGELRGVSSDGMICSTRELGLEDIENYPGIWELSSKFEPGTPLDQVVELYR